MARGINKVILIGNLGADPDVRFTQAGNPVANINIATDESYKDTRTGQTVPKTEWHRVILFGKLAEIAGQYLHKGSKVYIEGKLQTRKWQTQDGQDRYTTEIVVGMGGTLTMLDSPRDGQQGGQNPPQTSQGARNGAGAYQPPGQGQNASQGHQGGYPTGNNMPEPVEDFDDSIPF